MFFLSIKIEKKTLSITVQMVDLDQVFNGLYSHVTVYYNQSLLLATITVHYLKSS